MRDEGFMELKFKTISIFLIGSISFVQQIIVNQIGLDKKQQEAKGRKCQMGGLRNLSLK